MSDEKPVSLLLDAIAAETVAQARHDADLRAAEAEARAAAEPEAPTEAEEDDDEPWDPDANRPKRPAWLGRSAAELMAGREGRIASTTDVHTGRATETDD